MIKKKDLTKEEKKIYDAIRDDRKSALDYFKEGCQGLKEIKRVVVALTLNGYFHYPNPTNLQNRAANCAVKNNWLTPEEQLFLIRNKRWRDVQDLSVIKNPKYREEVIDGIIDKTEFFNIIIENEDFELLETLVAKYPGAINSFQSYLRYGKYRKDNVQDVFSKYKLLRLKKKAYLQLNTSSNSWVSQWFGGINANNFTKEEQKFIFTEDLLVKKVSMTASELKCIPSEYRTRDVCLAAVKKSGSALEFVPTEIKDKEICAEAITNSPTALRYVPKELQESKLIMRALLKNKNVRRYIKGRKYD